jgi:predicted phage baseplate assembly protein
MALQTIELDNLDWDQIVAAIQPRIAPDSQGLWTLQAPVDPGVTLLELFAWLLDQRIYWMAQTPASLSLASLALLGRKPMAAQAAVTILQLTDSANPTRSFPLAAASTLMQLGDTNPPVIFSLKDDVTLLPVTTIAVSVDGVDYTNDLQQCRPVSLVTAGKNAAQIEITLSLSAPLTAAQAGQFFALMVELENGSDVPPEWSPIAVSGVPVPALLTWSYTSTAGAAVASFAAAQVDDGTAGLRRPGIVRLPIPADWQPEAGTDASVTAYKILLQVASATLTYPPQLRRLRANVVLAQHRWARTKHPLTQAWLPLPGNTISLAQAPSDSSLDEFPPIEDTVQLQINEQDGQSYAWQSVSGFSSYGPADRVFVVDRAKSQIRFGDGLTGRLPVTSGKDASDITVTYQAGAGTAGNAGDYSSWEAVPASDGAVDPRFTAVNLAAGDGGADTETLAAAITSSNAALNQVNRAVSQEDCVTLALTTPGVGLKRAYAAVGYHPQFPCSTVPGAITVFVVPYAPRVQTDGDFASAIYVAAPLPDQGAVQAAQTYLNNAKLIGGEIFVCPVVYRKVWLSLTIAVDTALSVNLRQMVLTGLQNFLDPLTGGDDANGWPFGDPLRPSSLLKVAQAILGSSGDVQSVAVAIDNPGAKAIPCKDVAIRPNELVNLMHVDLVTIQRPVPLGGLR